MIRFNQLEKLTYQKGWDIIVIGGGASGLGVALDAVSRGLKVLCVEKLDWGKGTSSRSTKLIHGGVRYLKQGNVRLVREALKERDYILSKAKHNARTQPFIIPFYSWWEGIMYYTGLIFYSILSGSKKIGSTKWYGKKRTIEELPTIKQASLKGGILYYDGQFDDARLCIDLVKTIIEHGGTCINYCGATGFIKENGKLIGIEVEDSESNRKYSVYSDTIVNATGVFTDQVLSLDNPRAKKKVIPSRGSHLVLDKSFLQGDHAIMIPKTSDGRVLFIIPWLNSVVVGTTDVETDSSSSEPKVVKQEINFILQNAREYLTKKPSVDDIKAVFAGLRPLAAPEDENAKTKEISRGHKIFFSESGLCSIIGGKWTSFRKMGEDVINKLSRKRTKKYPVSQSSDLQILKPHNIMLQSNLLDKISYAVQEEMVVKTEDLIARRSRELFLNPDILIHQLDHVIERLATELKKGLEWKQMERAYMLNLINQYNGSDMK